MKQIENLEEFNEIEYLNKNNDLDIKERLINLNAESMKISSQVLNEDWELIDRFRYRKSKGKGYDYLYLIKCRHCGKQKLAKTLQNAKLKTAKCLYCEITEIIGKTYGCYKVLNYDHTLYRNKRYCRFYKVQCTQCGKEYIKERNFNQWSQYTRCRYCNSVEDKFGFSDLYSDYKYSAKIRNISWELEFSDFLNIVTKNCKYCGAEPTIRTKNCYEIQTNGIDRVDSSKGYIINNCVPCCTRCNYMKLDSNLDDFLNHVSKIYNHSINKGSTTIENASNLDGSE